MSGCTLPVAILIGGLATRLRPITESIPKAMIELNGEPIAHQQRLLFSRGIEHVVLCVGYRGEMIRDFVGGGSRYGPRVEFSFDGPTLLGSAVRFGTRSRCWARVSSYYMATPIFLAIIPPLRLVSAKGQARPDDGLSQ